MYNVYTLVNKPNNYMAYKVLTHNEYQKKVAELEGSQAVIFPADPNDISQQALEAKQLAQKKNIELKKAGKEQSPQSKANESKDVDDGQTIETQPKATKKSKAISVEDVSKNEPGNTDSTLMKLETFLELSHKEKSEYLEHAGLADKVDRRSSKKMDDFYKKYTSE